jgi:hypothetical protein
MVEEHDELTANRRFASTNRDEEIDLHRGRLLAADENQSV